MGDKKYARGEHRMNLDYYRELLEDIEGGEAEEELDKSIFAGN